MLVINSSRSSQEWYDCINPDTTVITQQPAACLGSTENLRQHC